MNFHSLTKPDSSPQLHSNILTLPHQPSHTQLKERGCPYIVSCKRLLCEGACKLLFHLNKSSWLSATRNLLPPDLAAQEALAICSQHLVKTENAEHKHCLWKTPLSLFIRNT